MSFHSDTNVDMFVFALNFQDCSDTGFLECRPTNLGAASRGY